MTARELLFLQADMVGEQLSKAIAGVGEPVADHRPVATLHSIRTTLIHMTDNYRALVADALGQKYAYGSWSPPDGELATLISAWNAARLEAVNTLRERLTDFQADFRTSFAVWPSWKVATEWLVAHDAYHLGQVCYLRLAAEPEWDMYEIYGVE